MKFSIVPKRGKITLYFVLGFVWVMYLAIGIWQCIKPNETLTPTVIVIELLMVALCFILTIVLVRVCLCTVTMDEFKIVRHIGKRVFNSASWSEIYKIELIETIIRGIRMLYINVIFDSGKNVAKAGKLDKSIFDKCKITIPYSKIAYDEIKKYYVNDIDNTYLSFHYDDNGKPL